MKITRRSPRTGKVNEMDINVTQEQINAWQHEGKMIQDVMPNLTDDEREFLKTGYTPEDWSIIFQSQFEADLMEAAEKAGLLADDEKGKTARKRFDALIAVAVKTGTVYTMDRNWLITNPGKFERCAIYAPYFHAQAGEGDVLDVLEDGMGFYREVFEPDEEERRLFPDIGKWDYLVCTEDSQGFVSVELTDDLPRPDTVLDDQDTALEEGTRMERAFGDGNDLGG